MKAAPGVLVVAAFCVAGCHTAKDVAVTTFHVIDAPASYVRRHIDQPDQATTTTTTTVSDVTNPGQPVEPSAASRRTTEQRSLAQSRSSPESQQTRSTATTSRSTPAPPPRTTSSQPQFPTAKPVPGKPGFVFSPYDANGGYVDVTGYPSGSKAKDPYSQKIFIVP